MITTKINIKSHLAEYIIGKYNHCAVGPVAFPANGDLYIVLWDLLSKRPRNAPIDTGNLEIILPNRAQGKRPEQYNYLSETAAVIIQKHIEALLYSELHHRLRENKRKGITYLETVFYFMQEYGIRSISEDAFIKDFYRMRRNEKNRRIMEKKIAI